MSDRSMTDFDVIYREFLPRLTTYAARLRAGDPENVAQETLTRAFRQWSSIDRDQDLRPLLFTIARNLVLDEHRRPPCDPVPDFTTCDRTTLADGPEEHALRAGQIHGVRVSMDALAPGDQELLWLRFWQKLSCPQIAAYLGATDVAVRQRLLRAGKRFKAHFKDLGVILIPVTAVLDILARIVRKPAAQVTAVGTVTMSAVVLAVVIGPGTPPNGEAAPAQPSPPSVAPAPSRPAAPRLTAEPMPRPSPPDIPDTNSPATTILGTGDQPAAPAANPATPIRQAVTVTPDPGPGPKETHAIEVDTPLGTAYWDSNIHSTGPILGPPDDDDLGYVTSTRVTPARTP